jgi:hypothetical protein
MEIAKGWKQKTSARNSDYWIYRQGRLIRTNAGYEPIAVNLCETIRIENLQIECSYLRHDYTETLIGLDCTEYARSRLV